MNYKNQKIQKYFNYIIIILFIIFLIVPFIGTIYGLEAKRYDNQNLENRKLAELPTLESTNFDFGNFADQMEEFLNDNFGFRSDLVKWNQLMHIKWFNTAPITDVVIDGNNSMSKKNVKIQGDVIIGQDGWYFYAKEQIVDDFRGVIPFSTDQLESIASKLTEKKKWLNDMGIEFVVMVAPNKSSIYPEFMPLTINKVNNKTRLDQLTDYLKNNTDITFIDPRNELITEKNKNILYEKTGTHWNELGAFIACQQLTKELKLLFPNIKMSTLDDYNIINTQANGSDLAAMLFIQKYVHDTQIYLQPKNGYKAKDDVKLFANPNDNPFMPLVAKTTDNGNLPRALIFRDSFMNRMEPFLSENFSRSSYVWSFEIDPTIVELEKPDVVIYEFVERKIKEVLLGIL